MQAFDGYRGQYPADEYPSRETALAIIDALGKLEDGTPNELKRLTGIANVLTVADRCFMVYGYPELEAAALARHMTEVYMRPSAAQEGATGGSNNAARPNTPAEPIVRPDDGYGFTPRQ